MLRSGLHLGPIRRIPWLAVREALLDAVVHRDWWRPDAEGARRLVSAWLAVTERISSGDFAEVTSFTNQGALQALNRLAAEGLVRRGDAARRGGGSRTSSPPPTDPSGQGCSGVVSDLRTPPLSRAAPERAPRHRTRR